MSTLIARRNRAKDLVDQALTGAYRLAARHSRLRTAFDRLVRHVRPRSALLRPARAGGQIDPRGPCDFVGALLALAVSHDDWRRPVEAWVPADDGPLPQFATLARHLLADWPVPPFMTSVWFKGCTAPALTQQGWFKHIGRGANLRTADIPLAYTKKMAHHFALAPIHLEVEEALRWGQVRGLGGSRELARTVAATRLGRDFENEDFWVSVIQFFVVHHDLDPAQVGPIVDYLHHQRFIPQDQWIEEGEIVDPGPAQPHLSMKGRTPRALLRQVAVWHERLKLPRRFAFLSWKRSAIGEFRSVAPGEPADSPCWTIRELLTSGALYREGKAMRHCVGTYVRACVRRTTSIWSLRLETDGRRRRVMTIEVDPATMSIRQARCHGNAAPSAKVRGVMERWALQEGLTIAESL